MCELLEAARKAQGNISYYEVAKRLGISTPLLNRWKNNKSQPNGVNTLRLAEMAGLSPSEALKIIEGGYTHLSLLIVTALTSLVFLHNNTIVNIFVYYVK